MSSHPDVVKDGVSDLSNGSATPLHVAAAEGQLAAVKALLEAGADVSAVNARGQTALQVGCCRLWQHLRLCVYAYTFHV